MTNLEPVATRPIRRQLTLRNEQLLGKARIPAVRRGATGAGSVLLSVRAEARQLVAQ